MYDKFENLEAAKRDRVLRAAMAEFSANGFDKASTNAMVKAAGISKGLLFHYFKSKKLLFLYLYDCCLDLMVQEYLAMDCLTDRDLFVRIRSTQQAKILLLARFPDMGAFVMAAYADQSPEIRADVAERNTRLVGISADTLFRGVDETLFRPGVDARLALDVIRWTFEGLGGKIVAAIKTGQVDTGRAFREADAYIDVLRAAFYKETGGESPNERH